jgi:serine/threonine-protein kinase HipA
VQIRPDIALVVALEFAPERTVTVGRLAMARGIAYLQYADAFIGAGLRLNPLAPTPDARLTPAAEPRAFRGLHGVFADSLPDAWGTELLRRRAVAHGIDFASLTPLDLLACVGRSGPGALVYTPEIDVGTDATVDLDVLAHASLRVTEGQDSAVIATLARLGGSSGGARPKILVGMDADGHLIGSTFPLPHGYDAWIIKFRGSREPIDAGPREAAYADMARAAGLDVTETRLIASDAGGPGYFATKRFDRGPDNSRIHVASSAALLETAWDIPSFGYDELLKATNVITRHHADVLMAYRRMVFNVLAHNRDDHAKQHAYLMGPDGAWRLAPAFDLTFSSGPGGEHYLTVNGRGTDITGADLARVAENHGIARKRAREIIDEVTSGVSRFREFARTYGVRRSSITEIHKAIDAQLMRGVSRGRKR